LLCIINFYFVIFIDLKGSWNHPSTFSTTKTLSRVPYHQSYLTLWVSCWPSTNYRCIYLSSKVKVWFLELCDNDLKDLGLK